MFEQATREQFRYPSLKGDLTTEQLWQLPLTSKSGFDLDTVAKTLNREIKAQGEESFVETSANPAKKVLNEKLAIVVHVIGVKQAENAREREAAQRRTERARLTEILHLRTQEQLMQLSPAELQAKIDALND